MKRLYFIYSLVLFTVSLNSQVFQATGNQYVSGQLSIFPTGVTPVNTFNGNFVITNPTVSGQYINIIRTGSTPWSIGTVYNTNYFAIGAAKTTDSEFTNPFFSISPSGYVGIGTSTPEHKLDIRSGPGKLVRLLTNNGIYNESALMQFQGRAVVGYDGVFCGLKLSTSDYSKPIVFTNSFDTDGTGELMRITGNGLVGIGTNQPLAKLHVNSGANNNYAAILATSTEGNNLVVSSYATQPANCKVFQISHEYSNSPANRNNGYIAFYRGSDVSGGYLDLGTNGISRLFINSAGNIGMGTSVIPSDYKLAVAGKIIATEVMIKLQSEWPDYVFKPGYKLKSISEVESFVKENHHLPGIPDAASVENEGVNMGEMQAKLLQKIEELTLYMIQQNNRIAELESKLTK